MLQILAQACTRPFATPGRALGLLAVYVVAHAAARLFLMPSSLGYDDAEQVLFAQSWSLGYRFQQPPLVTWLVLGLRDVAGLAPGLVSLTLLRSTLLVALHLGLYLAARHWIGDSRRAALASAALATTYTLGYLAHGDLLVSTALAAAVAFSLWTWGRLLERPTLGRTVAFGVVCGIGLLAKWNFVIVALACLLVGLARPSTRALVLSWRTPLVVAIATLMAGPTALWVLAHHPSFGGLSQEVLVTPAADRTAWEGAVQLALSALAFPQPMLVLVLLAAWPALGRLPERVRPLAWVMAVAFGLHALLIPLAGAVNFPERWMITVEMPLAILVFAAMRPEPARLWIVAATILVVVAGAWSIRTGIGLTDAAYCDRCRTRLPVAAFVDGLREAGFARGTVVVGDMHLGGNLQAALGGTGRVVMPTYPAGIWPAPGDGLCVAAGREGTVPPSTAALGGDLAARPIQVVRAPILGSTDVEQGMAFRLGPGEGQCR